MSEDQLSQGVGKSVDLSLTSGKQRHQGAKWDKEQDPDQPSVVVNGNGVRYHGCIYDLSSVGLSDVVSVV